MNIPAEQQPNIKPSKCFGGLVIFITIHAKAEPNMNVARILTGMNHLNESKSYELKLRNQSSIHNKIN
jgi:hypothetical protein